MSTHQEFAAEHDALEALVAEHALGTLDPVHRDRVEAHLADCAACRATFAEVAELTAELETIVTPAHAVAAPADAREGLLAAARRTPQDRRAAAPASRHATRRRRWSLPSLLAGAGAACTILVLAVLLADSRQHSRSLERRLEDARGDQVAVLRGASISDLDARGPFGDARAQVALQKDAGLVGFRDVPAPPDDMVWQVWLVTEDSAFRSLGVIEQARREAYLPIQDVDPDDIERIIVTLEPAGGSTEPTAEEVAGATI